MEFASQTYRLGIPPHHHHHLSSASRASTARRRERPVRRDAGRSTPFSWPWQRPSWRGARRGTRVDKRSIALPREVKQELLAAFPFLKRLSFLKHPEFSLGCGACKHMVGHAVEYARGREPAPAASGWRMDERRTVSARHQMLDVEMFGAVQGVKPQNAAVVLHRRRNLCEEVGPLGKSVQDSIKRACVDFVEFFEDDLTTALRQHRAIKPSLESAERLEPASKSDGSRSAEGHGADCRRKRAQVRASK